MPTHPVLIRVSGRGARTALAAASLASLLGACASASRPEDQVSIRPSTVRVDTPGGTVEARTVAEDRAESRAIQAPMDLAWKLLPAVYGELGLPVNTYIDATHQIAVKSARMRGRVGKVRMPSIITCGADVTGEDKASSYEVTLDVVSAVSPKSNTESTITTMVTANARPMSTSGEPVRCVTTGQLERSIASTLNLKTAAARAATP